MEESNLRHACFTTGALILPSAAQAGIFFLLSVKFSRVDFFFNIINSTGRKQCGSFTD